MSDDQLPLNARGIRIAELSILFARDKIVFAGAGSKHITAHLGGQSGVLDIHETERSTGNVESHRALYSISHANLAALLDEIGPRFLDLLEVAFVRLRPGWIRRQRLTPVLGLLPDCGELASVSRISSRKLVVVADKLAARARIPEDVEDLYDLSDGDAFSIYDFFNRRAPRLVGVGVKGTDALGRPRLIWIRSGRFKIHSETLNATLLDAARRFGTFYVPLPWL